MKYWWIGIILIMMSGCNQEHSDDNLVEGNVISEGIVVDEDEYNELVEIKEVYDDIISLNSEYLDEINELKNNSMELEMTSKSLEHNNSDNQGEWNSLFEDEDEYLVRVRPNQSYSEVEAMPFDETSTSPSFSKFIEEYRIAIDNYDIDYIIDHMNDKTIVASFYGNPGIDRFLEEYKLTERDVIEESEFWSDMKDAMKYGFYSTSEANTGFKAPYYDIYLDSITYGVEVFNLYVCTAENVNVRNEADIDSPIIEQIDYLILKDASNSEVDVEWREIILPDGRVGYIHDDYVRHLSDKIIEFSYVDGKWLLNSFRNAMID